MRFETADALARNLIGARVEGIGVLEDGTLLIDFGFKGTDDGDLTMRLPIRETRVSGPLVDPAIQAYYDDGDDDA